ncbi:unnamed protein product, partial [Callosobruchus maculatus]
MEQLGLSMVRLIQMKTLKMHFSKKRKLIMKKKGKKKKKRDQRPE